MTPEDNFEPLEGPAAIAMQKGVPGNQTQCLPLSFSNQIFLPLHSLHTEY